MLESRPVGVGMLPAAYPAISREEWCHAECFQRWSALDGFTKGVLGGHIHFNASSGSWEVPGDVPLALLGIEYQVLLMVRD